MTSESCRLSGTRSSNNAKKLLSKCAEVSSRIKANLIKDGVNFHLTLDNVAITHLTFGREFMKAIKSKQVVSQEADRKQYLVQRADQERIASMNRAEGKVEAATIITAAMEWAGSAILEVRRIESTKEIAAKFGRSTWMTTRTTLPTTLVVCGVVDTCRRDRAVQDSGSNKQIVV